MTSKGISEYIKVRNFELSQDEILELLDLTESPQINHIIYENGMWNMWDNNGNNFLFKMRIWK